MRHQLFSICAALTLASGLSLVPPPSAEAAFNDSYHRIRASHSNKCLSYGEGGSPNPMLELDVVGRANQFADLAYSDLDVIGVVGFHYNVQETSPGVYVNCPAQHPCSTIRAGFVDIGKAITHR